MKMTGETYVLWRGRWIGVRELTLTDSSLIFFAGFSLLIAQFGALLLSFDISDSTQTRFNLEVSFRMSGQVPWFLAHFEAF